MPLRLEAIFFLILSPALKPGASTVLRDRLG
jgi:hypothetical protein